MDLLHVTIKRVRGGPDLPLIPNQGQPSSKKAKQEGSRKGVGLRLLPYDGYRGVVVNRPYRGCV